MKLTLYLPYNLILQTNKRSSTAIYRHAKDKVSSLVTLGTPHISPESALVDQTRGLLREIASSDACSSQSLYDREKKSHVLAARGSMES